ncbi:CG40198 [Drosophila busckii]|uniref:CG40198 n=3 Tax=Drosophila busckii TaxID=30019 RepID=A0A0M4F3Z7_DROBS|nr:CG40198 [Drosophila busckii]
MVEAKPIFFKIFAPSAGYSSVSTATVAPANTQFISNLLVQKINLLDNFLRAKSSFGYTKTVTYGVASSTTTTTTERSTTEVNTDFIPEVSSTTQTATPSTTTTTVDDLKTTEDDIDTTPENDIDTTTEDDLEPTVIPQKPVTTSTTAAPTRPPLPTKRTTRSTDFFTTTRAGHGYAYRTPAGYSL